MPYPTDDIERYRDYHRVVHGNSNAYEKYTKIDKELFLIDDILKVSVIFTFVKKNPFKNEKP